MKISKYFCYFCTVISFAFLSVPLTFAQQPVVQWQNTINTTVSAVFSSCIQTSDGGFLVGGKAYFGIEGDKTVEGYGNYDYWIIKLSTTGAIEWQNCYGGSYIEELYEIVATPDGGFILVGSSSSGISGVKTSISQGSLDYWVVKIDASGNILWQKDVGGSLNDELRSVRLTPDGGYLLGGTSMSPASGDKSENAFFLTNDFWVVKLDSASNVEWEKTIGGADQELLSDIQVLTDGNCMLVGQSASGISGNKTVKKYGSYDYWLVKINPADGALLWQKTYGGSLGDTYPKMALTSDGGFIISGSSESNTTGVKTENCFGDDDYWVIKCNSAGNIQWQKTIGGSMWDYAYSIAVAADNGFLIGGYSISPVSGLKSESSSQDDYWVVKLDQFGNIDWQNTLGGSGPDQCRKVLSTLDGGYFYGGDSDSNISPDKSENGSGFWCLKIAPEGCYAETCNGLDDDCNGVIDDFNFSATVSAAGFTTFCQGGSVTLNATYTGPSIRWKKNGANIPGATTASYIATTSGNYTAYTYNACASAESAIISVVVNTNPTASITAGGATTFCAGGSVTLTETPVTGSTYQWYKGATAIVGATTTNYIATIAGNYKCRVTKTASGCFKNSNVITVTVPCKEGEELIQNNTFNIFPNPNNGTFYISALSASLLPLRETDRPCVLEIFNSLGQQIYTQHLSTLNGKINEMITLNNLTSGLYFIRITQENFYSEQKFVVE